MAMGLGTLAVLGGAYYFVGREYLAAAKKKKKKKTAKKEDQKELPPATGELGGNYRLAVVQNGEVVGASCGSCGHFMPNNGNGPGPKDGWCDYFKAAAGSRYVCDAWTQGFTEDVAEILWGDPEACDDWYLPDRWIVEVARPLFYEVMTETEAAGIDLGTLDPMIVTHIVLDESIPATCPIPGAPDGDFRLLQSQVPGAADYFENAAVLGLYWHVLEGVEGAIAQIQQTGEGVFFPLS